MTVDEMIDYLQSLVDKGWIDEAGDALAELMEYDLDLAVEVTEAMKVTYAAHIVNSLDFETAAFLLENGESRKSSPRY